MRWIVLKNHTENPHQPANRRDICLQAVPPSLPPTGSFPTKAHSDTQPHAFEHPHHNHPSSTNLADSLGTGAKYQLEKQQTTLAQVQTTTLGKAGTGTSHTSWKNKWVNASGSKHSPTKIAILHHQNSVISHQQSLNILMQLKHKKTDLKLLYEDDRGSWRENENFS